MLDRLSAQLGDTFAGKRFDRLTAFSFRDLAVARHRVTTRQNWPRLSYEADSKEVQIVQENRPANVPQRYANQALHSRYCT